ncbi:hypothetical protein ElyMa_000100800, partial [Elysia marginata]
MLCSHWSDSTAALVTVCCVHSGQAVQLFWSLYAVFTLVKQYSCSGHCMLCSHWSDSTAVLVTVCCVHTGQAIQLL